MAIFKVYTGAVFETAIYKVYNGTIWDDVPSFWDGSSWVELNPVSIVLTLSGEPVIHETAGGPAIAGIRINIDGTIDKREGGTYTQIDSGTDWIDPNGAADDSANGHHFRITSVTYTSGSFNLVKDMATDGTWYNLTGGALEMSGRDAIQFSAGTINISFTLEVRKGSSGGAEASGSYSIFADYEA